MNITRKKDTTQEYLDDSRIGSSKIKLAIESELNYKVFQNAKSTKSQDFGTAAHMAILEPELVPNSYYFLDDAAKVSEIGGGNPRATKLYKEWYAEQEAKNAGKQPLPQYEYDGVMRLVESMEKDPRYHDLVLPQDKEVSFYVDDFFAGLSVKCRPDCCHPHLPELDIKTTKDMTPRGFFREVYKYKYHLQRALYRLILREYGYAIPKSIILAIGNSAPYNYEFYTIPDFMMQEGEDMVYQGLLKIKHIEEHGARYGFAHDHVTDEHGCIVLADWREQG